MSTPQDEASSHVFFAAHRAGHTGPGGVPQYEIGSHVTAPENGPLARILSYLERHGIFATAKRVAKEVRSDLAPLSRTPS